jgi:hypothetical protein
MDMWKLSCYTKGFYNVGGETEELCYLTPRILECYTQQMHDPKGQWDVEDILLGNKFYRGKWWEWEEPLADALNHYLITMWQTEVLETTPDEGNHFYIDYYFWFFCSAMPDITPLFKDLLAYPAILEEIYLYNEFDLQWNKSLGIGFWKSYSVHHDQIVDFLLSSEVEDTILHWYYEK